MRVSDNTSRQAVNESIRRTKGRMEQLQMQNATQKKLLSASDDPAAHSKIMDIRTQSTVNAQFESNAMIAKNRLVLTDNALSELYDIFVRAKEIAINQSSDASANADSRLGVAQEVSALYKQMVGVANRRMGETYLFSGFKTLSEPFTPDGKYKGDDGKIPIEIQKDVFISTNLAGTDVFEVKRKNPNPELKGQTDSIESNHIETRGPASVANRHIDGLPSALNNLNNMNMFHELDSLRVGLLTNDTQTIRDGLDTLDQIIGHITVLRTKVSSRVAGIDNAIAQTSKTDQANTELMSQLEDADYAELWSNLAKEETVLRSSLQSAQKLIQPTLLDFLK